MHEEDKVIRQKILAEIVYGYAAIVDGLGYCFVEDWVEMYPDAKVVLGLRSSSQAWLDSVHGSIGKVFDKGLMYYMTYLVPEMHFGFLVTNLWHQRAREQYGVEVRSTDYYVCHIQHVRQAVPGGWW